MPEQLPLGSTCPIFVSNESYYGWWLISFSSADDDDDDDDGSVLGDKDDQAILMLDADAQHSRSQYGSI